MKPLPFIACWSTLTPVSVTVSASDNYANRDGRAAFTRRYDIGTSVTVIIRVPTSEITIEVAAEVRWKEATGDEVGMGIKFQRLEVEQLLQLSEYFASLTGTEAAL